MAEEISNKIRRFEYARLVSGKGFDRYTFGEDFKDKLESLLPASAIPVTSSHKLSVYQIEDTSVEIWTGTGIGCEDCLPYLQIHHTFPIKRQSTLNLLQIAFK